MKRFSDGEIITRTLRAAVNVTFLDRKLVSKITLSQFIFGRIRQESLKNINGSLNMKAVTCTEMDKSTDVTRTAQLSVFVSGIHIEINITECLSGAHACVAKSEYHDTETYHQKTFRVKRAAA